MPLHEPYRALLDLSPDGIVLVRADGSILEVNDRLVALFGYSRADLTDVPLEFLLPPACEAVRAIQVQPPDLQPQANTAMDFWVQNAEGTTMAVDITLAALQAEDNQDRQPPLVCISVRDTTRHKRAEQLLDEARIKSEQVLSDQLLLANTLPLAIFQWESDADGHAKYSFISARVQDMLGIAAERIVADPSLLFAPMDKDDARMLAAHIAEVRAQVRGGSAKAAFSVAVRAQVQGRLIWLRIATVYAGLRVDGRSIWNGYMEDITRRKKIEEDKEQATFQFKTLWEKSPDTYVFLGQQGVLSCNAPALDLFGMDSTDALIGSSLTDPRFSPPLQAGGQASAALFAEILRYASALARQSVETRAELPVETPVAPAHAGLRLVRGSVKFEWLLLRHGSTVFTAEIVVTPMQIDANDGYLLICQDVSLQRQAQTELLNAKLAAEDTARTKADFLANMSHEIRTPMNAIVGLSHLLLQSELSRTQRDFLRKIQDSGQHLLGIINDILDFSKMEAGKLSVERRDFSLAKVLDNVANLVEDKARAKGLQLVFDIEPEVPDALHGDALRLGQILINYANNAVKFTRQGEIRIRARVLEDRGHQVQLRFEVQDTGIGLSEEQIQRLFQSFQQADSSTTRKYGGTGLGLAICKNLAELMHGSVGLSSELGQGSTFWFAAPFDTGTGQSAEPNTQPGDLRLASGGSALAERMASIAGARVLLVEDNALNQLVGSELLRGAGLLVDVVDNGRQAVDCIVRTPAHWDLVMMDMQMPVLDGVAATREIRQALGQALPVIVAMTANAMPQHRQICLEAGMQDFITKPIDPEQLWATLLRWLAPQAGRSAAGTDLLAWPATNTEPETDAVPLPQGIAGLDTVQGLKRVLGKTGSYLAMLRSFVDNQAQAIARVHSALAAQDWEAAEREAHTLKGVAGNLGATRVQQDAGVLEEALGQRPALARLEAPLQQAERSLLDLVVALQAQLPAPAELQASDANAQRLPTLVAELKSLLENDDSAALDLFGDNAALLKFAYPANYPVLEAALAEYDFARALEQL